MTHHRVRNWANIVVLCGSTRFRDEILDMNRQLTLDGKIVLMPGVFQHQGDQITDAQKEALDRLHLQKIDLADEVVVICPGGYIGSSTNREVQYALSQGKTIRYTEEIL